MTQAAGILVAGAGPAGLALALQAHDHGASVRVIERRPAAFRPSRALILHSRTLEVLRPLGVTDALLARADIAPAVNLHLGCRVVRVRLADLPLPDTAFPHLSLIRQMDVEAVLAQALADRGVEVERGKELVRARDGPEGVRVTLRSDGAVADARADFVVGCDGPASVVRSEAGIGWPGAPYPVEIVLADVELGGDLAEDVAHVVAARHGLVFAFPLGERATWRLLATRPAGDDRLAFGQPGPPVRAADLQSLLDEAHLGASITDLAWSSRVNVQHRVASQFRQGRLFLAGDAAHAYSPATGQGMNAAILDSTNLGWKLAFGTSQPGRPDSVALLDSYDRERRPVAHQVLAMTHVAFWGEAGTGPIPALLRARIAPVATPVISLLLGRRRLVAAGVRVLSQLRASYRTSPLSMDGTLRDASPVRAGDRLPDETVTADGRRVRLHELLACPGVHVLLDRDAYLPDSPAPGPFVHVHRISSSQGRGLLAVRPDGHVGLRCRAAEPGRLTAWLSLISAPGWATPPAARPAT